MSTVPDAGVLHPFIATLAEVGLEPMALRLGPDIETMEFEGKVLWQSDDRRRVIGVESITPEQNLAAPADPPRLTFSQYDYFIAGRVTIDSEGQPPLEVKAGDIIISPAGVKTTWTIHETMVKLFMTFADDPIDVDAFFGPR